MPLTPEQKQKILDCYAQSRSVYACVREFGHCRKTVIQVLKAAGITPRPPGVPANQRQAILDLYATSKSVRACVRMSGCAYSTVTRIIRGAGFSPGISSVLTQEQKDEILDLYALTGSIVACAKELGHDRGTIARLLRKHPNPQPKLLFIRLDEAYSEAQCSRWDHEGAAARKKSNKRIRMRWLALIENFPEGYKDYFATSGHGPWKTAQWLKDLGEWDPNLKLTPFLRKPVTLADRVRRLHQELVFVQADATLLESTTEIGVGLVFRRVDPAVRKVPGPVAAFSETKALWPEEALTIPAGQR